MFSPCSLLVVGWLEPLFFLNMGNFYSKTIKNTVSHSNTHCKLKMDPSHSKSDDPTCSQTKTLCQGYNIADCPVFGSRHHWAMATDFFSLGEHHTDSSLI